jgi:metal transporter CNNM
MLSIELTILVVLLFTSLAAMCSGLNIALMSLNLAELRRKAKLGNHLAKRALPLRESTHLTLAAILLTNVAAVSATSLVLENLLAGLLAGIITTLIMVIFGEILPQAYFNRNALLFFARLAPVMHLMIILTYPVSKPLQLLLDRLFEPPQNVLHSRHELGIMIAEHIGHEGSELDEDEVEIIRGALQLSEKHVSDIMVPIDSVYWLTPDAALDTRKIRELHTNGHSRIPIFNSSLTHCYGILIMKSLFDVDLEEKTYHVSDLNLHPVQTVGSKTALDTMLRKFISSHTHLIPIVKDDVIVGIVTIEDLIEEIVGQEIEDETDKRLLRR